MAALIETLDPPPHEQLWRILADRLAAGLGVATLTEDDQSRTLLANPALRALLRCGPSDDPDLLGAHACADPADRNRLLATLREQGAVSEYLVRLRRHDGSTLWVEATASFVPDTSGQAPPSGVAPGLVRPATTSGTVYALLRDVGERRKREEQSRDLYQQLLQAEKMAALGQTMSGVAHELNNPLGAILALADRLRQQGARTSLASGLETLHKEAERAARIARQLLTFARKRHTTRLMVPVNEVVRDTVRLREVELQHASIDVTTELAGDLPDVFADPHQLQQVVLNLLINAEQAMLHATGRGRVHVRTALEDTDSVLIEVTDDGPGMSADVATRVFDPFFTTKDVGEGTGLGLAVARAIVDEHGGRITVQSSPGSGARFLISLPAAGAPLHAPLHAPVVGDAATDTAPMFGQGLRVLLADDEPALAGAVADTLRDVGFEVTLAQDGQEALAKAESQTFDAVICDLRMPRVDGPAFYRAIAAVSPPQARRVIFVTGDVTGTEAARFLDESGCRWLAKPFRLAELLRVVRDVVG